MLKIIFRRFRHWYFLRATGNLKRINWGRVMAMSIDQSLSAQEDAEAKDEAIELLAEQLIATATKAARDVIAASNYNLTMLEIVNETSHSTEFNELYYSAAKKLIKVAESRA